MTEEQKKSCISIARKNPYGFAGEKYADLAPSADLLKRYKTGEVDDVQYTAEYREQLAKLDAKKVAADLAGKILLCYEKNGFCHRHLVAEWLKANGVVCEELHTEQKTTTSSKVNFDDYADDEDNFAGVAGGEW